MNKPLILVAEDDAAVRNLITATLETYTYRFQTAPAGKAAVLETVSHNPDVILLDLGLPDMDGVEAIRKPCSWLKTPIIVISARSENTDKIDALDAGANGYLTKPFSAEELPARLRVTFRRLNDTGSDTVQASVFTNGDFKIDFAAGCAFINETELHLTPMEYKRLCLLFKNVGKAPYQRDLGQRVGQRRSLAARLYGCVAKKN